MDSNPSVALIIRFSLPRSRIQSRCSGTVICRCSSVRRAHQPSPLEQSKRRDHRKRALYRVDESRDLPHFFVVEICRNRYAAACYDGRDKIDSAAPAVDGPARPPAAIDLHRGFIHATGKIGRLRQRYQPQPFSTFRRITLNPAVNRGVIDIPPRSSSISCSSRRCDAVFASTSVQPAE